MGIKNVFDVSVDIKRSMTIRTPVVTMGDTICFNVSIYDDGKVYDITNATQFMIFSKRQDGQVIAKTGTLVSPNKIKFDLGTSETSIAGVVHATIQIYDSDGRVSTFPFYYHVAHDPSNDYVMSSNEVSALQNILNQVSSSLSEFKLMGDYNLSTSYKKYNIVTFNGSSYMAKQDTQGNPPTDTRYWQLLAQKGTDGGGSGSGSTFSPNVKVNNVSPDQNGNITLTASDVGAETPLGSQAKANQAEANAKAYTDSKVSTITYPVSSVNGKTGNVSLVASDVGAVDTSVYNNHIADYVKHPAYAAASGSANTYTVTLNPAPTSYVEGMAVVVKINVDNTGASTINVNALGSVPIKRSDGTDVQAGTLKANSIYTLRYNGINFILQGEGSGPSSSGMSNTDKQNFVTYINNVYDM